MMAPSAINIDYIQKNHSSNQKKDTEVPRERIISERELNSFVAENKLPAQYSTPPGSENEHIEKEVDYTFGDAGSSWRMTKLKGVYAQAEEEGRPIEEVAIERFGSLREFDYVREEKIEIDRRKQYGSEYTARKDKPSGVLYRERMAKITPSLLQNATVLEPKLNQNFREDQSTTALIPASGVTATHTKPVDQNTLNKLKAEVVRARLRNASNLAALEAQYEAAISGIASPVDPIAYDAANSAAFAAANTPIVLGAMESRALAGTRGEVREVTSTRRGRERGLVEANDDMSVEDMVREERRTKGASGGEGLRLAERIAKDSRFDDSLEYMDENAEKLARRVHRSERNLKNVAVHEYRRVQRALDSCPLCYRGDENEERKSGSGGPVAPVVSLGMRTYLTLTAEPEVSEGGAVIVPIDHHRNLLECDDDEWEEIRNFMKSLTRLYHEQGRDVIFYENAARPHRYAHATLVAVPIPYELGATAPAFFKEGILARDEEWSQNSKLIDTGKKAREGMGRMAFRRSLAKEMPYFHVWFDLDGGLGHVVENEQKWPRGDLFAREILGGMVDAPPNVIAKQARWRKGDGRVAEFRKGWRKFDWTRVLTDG